MSQEVKLETDIYPTQFWVCNLLSQHHTTRRVHVILLLHFIPSAAVDVKWAFLLLYISLSFGNRPLMSFAVYDCKKYIGGPKGQLNIYCQASKIMRTLVSTAAKGK